MSTKTYAVVSRKTKKIIANCNDLSTAVTTARQLNGIVVKITGRLKSLHINIDKLGRGISDSKIVQYLTCCLK